MNSVIYEPSGKALEYCGLACNLYKGCDHGCVYCYAPAATRSSRESFDNPLPRKDILQRLAHDAPAMSTPMTPDERPVLLSFTSDPYQRLDEKLLITREAIELLHRAGMSVTVLTKGGHRAERDFDLMGLGDTHAASLTLLDDAESLKWEPGAAVPRDRIQTLKHAHAKGLRTWVSLEPVIDPEAVYEIIAMTHSFVGMYKVGVLNYHAHAKTIDWERFAVKVIETLESFGCQYYIKEDLRKWLPEKQLCKLV